MVGYRTSTQQSEFDLSWQGQCQGEITTPRYRPCGTNVSEELVTSHSLTNPHSSPQAKGGTDNSLSCLPCPCRCAGLTQCFSPSSQPENPSWMLTFTDPLPKQAPSFSVSLRHPVFLIPLFWAGVGVWSFCLTRKRSELTIADSIQSSGLRLNALFPERTFLITQSKPDPNTSS